MLKTYFRYLTNEDRVRCQIELERGQVRKFVIQYEIHVQEEWAAVTRFDTSHNAVHRDLIAPNETVSKRWFLQFNFDEGLTFAYNDIDRNVPRKPRLVGGVKGHNMNDITLPGSPTLGRGASKQLGKIPRMVYIQDEEMR